jgi:hypothetical protein
MYIQFSGMPVELSLNPNSLTIGSLFKLGSIKKKYKYTKDVFLKTSPEFILLTNDDGRIVILLALKKEAPRWRGVDLFFMWNFLAVLLSL